MLTNRKEGSIHFIEVKRIDYARNVVEMRCCVGAQRGPWHERKLKHDKVAGPYFVVMGVAHTVKSLKEVSDKRFQWGDDDDDAD